MNDTKRDRLLRINRCCPNRLLARMAEAPSSLQRNKVAVCEWTRAVEKSLRCSPMERCMGTAGALPGMHGAAAIRRLVQELRGAMPGEVTEDGEVRARRTD